jgi:hypothetical protein
MSEGEKLDLLAAKVKRGIILLIKKKFKRS